MKLPGILISGAFCLLSVRNIKPAKMVIRKVIEQQERKNEKSDT